MIRLKIRHPDGTDTIQTDKDATLLQVLRDHGYDIYAPCGGEGTCGKCKVWLKGEGSVSACRYRVRDPIELVLPGRKEARILVEQHTHTRELPLLPGPVMELSENPHGVALDLGTTTLVYYLVNLVTGSLLETRALPNPQNPYGADVISRIQYASGEADGLSELQRIILDSLNQQLEHFAGFAGISAEDIVKITVSGNTTMLHLLMAVDPLPIALAPFRPGFTDMQVRRGGEFGLRCHPEAQLVLLPSVSAYVGADVVGGLASIRPSAEYRKYLFMDIGTNGELALVSPGRVLCCSAAAGPAFEGARISCGMSATEGAISAYDEKGITIIGDNAPDGICGSGLVDIVAYLIRTGKVGPDGMLKKEFVVAEGKDTESGGPLTITQQDIREIQLAKAAIAAGNEILLKEGGLNPGDLDAVFLAGGFGNYINPANAVSIGLILPELEGKIIPLGNTSGTGALLAMKSMDFIPVLEDMLQRTDYIELSGHRDFTLAFAMHMNFSR